MISRTFSLYIFISLHNVLSTYCHTPQCVMPVFEDLLPEPYNTTIVTLLFKLVQWLSFAKLRQHTETTLTQFEAATTSLGNQVRTFAAKVCPRFETTDTP